MKQILTIILMFFYLISCSSTDEKESSNEIKKPVKSSQKKLHITPKEYEVIKKLKLKPGLLETDSGSIMQISFSIDTFVNKVFKIDKKVYYRGTQIQFRNAYTDAGFQNNDKQVVTDAMVNELALLLSNCDSQKYCNDTLVDIDNDGIIDYIPLPKKSDSMSCYVHLNSDGTQNYIECNYQDKESRTIKRSIDDNENGYPNQFIYYDPQKETKTNLCITKIDYDANNNRRLDKWDYYENCKLVRREIDENENGTVEEITYYNKKGEYDRFWSIGGDNVKKANDALEAKKYDEAIKFYKAANQELYREWGSDTDKICFNLNNIGQAYYNKGDGVQTVEVMTALSKNKLCSWTGYDAFLYIGFAQKYLMKNNEAAKAGFENAVDFSKKKDPTAAIPIDALFQLIMIHYENKDYQKCIATVKQIPEKELSNVGKSSVFFFSGTCQLNLRNYDQAEKDFETSLKYAESNEQKSATYYNFACADALQNKRSSAINRLKKAISFSSNQGSVRKAAKTDSDFTNLANDPEFKKLVE